ncbi:MAG TPA: VOC family protein [Polyangia bacterium]|jgi:PhnB protein|nr:VOC family protein [Polyangia bacterium]
MAKATKPIPDGYHSVTPTLTIDGAAAAIEWYKKIFGATELVRMPGPEGKLLHAEIRIGDSVVMLSDPFMDAKDPKALGGASGGLMIYTDDVDSMFKRAVEGGAKVLMPLGDMFWGDRFGRISDPFGHQWALATHIEDLTPEEMQKRQEEAMRPK